jgi:hypothetical protein
MTKSRKKRWAWYVARTREREVHTGTLWGNLKGRDYLEDQGVDGRIILIWIFKKCDGEAWTGLIRLRTETGGGHL